MKRRSGLLIGLVVVVVGGIAALELSGVRGSLTGAATGEASGCVAQAPSTVDIPEEVPEDIRVFEPGMPKGIAPTERPDGDPEVVPDRYLVSVTSEAKASSGVGDDGAFRLGFPPLDEAFLRLQTRSLQPAFPELGNGTTRAASMGVDRIFAFESSEPRGEILETLYAIDQVEWVEPDVTETVLGVPDDPYYGYQWHLHQLGLETVWDSTDGSGVTVAVLDTGVSAGTDGYRSLLVGIDLVTADGDATDEYGHGTHVAGTIAQASNNGVGVAGVAPGANILPVRVLDAAGYGYASRPAQGIIWAADNGAHVINMSLGSAGHSQTREAACDYAYDAGVVVVASSGNDSYTDFVCYPAANDSVIAVGATDFNREVSYYSNQGAELELAAPGGDATVDNNGDGLADGVLQEAFLVPYDIPWGYVPLQGTSMAAPHVSGVAALLYASGGGSSSEIREALTASAVDLGVTGRDTVYGYGLVDATAALAYSPPSTPELKLKKLKQRPVGPARVMLRWFTPVETTHVVEGANGFTKEEPNLVHVHRALVRGEPGTTVDFEITVTAADGTTGSATLPVEFPEPLP